MRAQIIGRLQFNFPNIRTLLIHVQQQVSEQNIGIALFHVAVKDPFGYFGLKYPLFKTSIMLAELAVKIQRQSLYNILVPDVCLPQTARAQPPQPSARFYQDNRLSSL